MHAGLGRLGRLTRGQLEQGQVDALAEAEKDRAVLQVFVGDLQPQGLRVEIPDRPASSP